MTRTLFCLPLALSLLSSTALAGPPEPLQAAGGDSLVLDCQINGQSERFAISDGAMADGSGRLQVLAEDLYALTRDGTTYVIDPTGVQIDRGPDRGKWDCTEVTDAAEPGAVPDAETTARLLELEGEVANLQAALRAAQGDRQAAILMRETAMTAREAAEADLAEAQAEIEELTAQVAAQEALGEQLAAAEAAHDAARQELEQATARAAAIESMNAAYQSELDAAEAEIAEMRLEFEGLQEALEAERVRTRDAQGQVEALGADLNVALAQLAAEQEARAQAEAALAGLRAEADEAEETGASQEEPVAQDAEMPDAAPETETMPAATDETDEAAAPAPFDADAALARVDAAELSPIARAALGAAIEQARDDPAMVGEVVERLRNALGQ